MLVNELVLTSRACSGLKKFEEELALIHTAFTTHVETHRPSIPDVQAVCTGEAWLATHALPLGLVDEVHEH